MSSLRSSKRARLSVDSHPMIGWSCPACTFHNPNGAFKCEMCNCKKGTSTRIASTVDSSTIELQRSIQEQIDKQKREKSGRRSDSAAGNSESNGRQRHNSGSEDESNDSTEAWRLLGDTETSSSFSAASSSSDHHHHHHRNSANNNNTNSHRRSSSPPSQPKSSTKASSASSSSRNNATSKTTSSTSSSKAKTAQRKSLPRDDSEGNVPSSSASSCSTSISSMTKNGKKLATKSLAPPSPFSANAKEWPRLANINRQTGRETLVTVRGVTVVITDYEVVP